MRVSFKRNVYITVELDRNLDRHLVTQTFHEVFDEEFREFVSSIRTRRALIRDFEEKLGAKVNILYSDQFTEMKLANKGISEL